MRYYSWAAVGLFLVATSAKAGFEIGNGAYSQPNVEGNYTLRMVENYEARIDGKATEVLAPRSDGSNPRTRLKINVYPLALSAEQAVKNMIAAGKGWVEFSLGEIAGLHRETQVRKNWDKLEMYVFRKNEKFVISLEGDKKRSAAYAALADSLLADIED